MRGPRLPQLEKALAQKQRPNTAINKINKYIKKKKKCREFPGDPVVRTLSFHCKGCSFNSWSGNPTSHAAWPKKKKKCQQKKGVD